MSSDPFNVLYNLGSRARLHRAAAHQTEPDLRTENWGPISLSLSLHTHAHARARKWMTRPTLVGDEQNSPLICLIPLSLAVSWKPVDMDRCVEESG